MCYWVPTGTIMKEGKRERHNMKRLILLCFTFLLLMLTACTAEPANEQASDEGDETVITVYRSPT